MQGVFFKFQAIKSNEDVVKTKLDF